MFVPDTNLINILLSECVLSIKGLNCSECVKVEIKIRAITYRAVRKMLPFRETRELRSICQMEVCLPVNETVC